MRTARLVLVLVSLAALLLFAAPAWADTISVPTDYKTIQGAVDAAWPGDLVLVHPGVYAEVVTVDKAITLAGMGSEYTVVDGGGSGHVIEVVADGVTVRDLAVRNGSMDERYGGIDLDRVSGCLVEGCLATTTWAGVRLDAAVKNTVRGCTFTDVTYGAELGDAGSSDNLLVDCVALRCAGGFWAYAGSDGLHLLRCSAAWCSTGAQIGWSSGWVVECCDFFGNENGIVLDTASSGVVRHCIMQLATYGLSMAGLGTTGNDIYGNLFEECSSQGIAMQSSCVGNQVHDNRVWGGPGGVWIANNVAYPNHGNVFYRNDFRDNVTHAADDNGWGADSFSNGYPWGNYWDNAGGPDDYSGPDQDVPGPDGVFDVPHFEYLVEDPYPSTTPDTTPPDTVLMSGPTDWVATRDVAFAWKGTDDRAPADCLAFRLSLDGELPILDTVTGVAYEGLAEGAHTFSVAARDCTGNDDDEPATAEFGVDISPPVTEDDGDTAWHQYDTTIHFTAWDKYSGADHTEYSVDGGGSWSTGSEVTIAAPSDGSGDGTFRIWYRSVDAVGNVEEPRSCIVKISTQGFAFDHIGAALGEADDRVNDVEVADLDGDGDMDVVAGCGSGAEAEVVAWENDGSPFDGDWTSVGVGGSADGVHSVGAADLADFDADGRTDIASVTSAYGGVGSFIVWQNTATPWAGPWTALPLWGAFSMGSVAALDLNGDPWPDIALSYNEGMVVTFFNPGPPLGAEWPFSGAGVGGSGMISAIAPGDFNGDGLDDIATSIGYLPSLEQWVWVNPAGAAWPRQGYANTAATSVAVGDLDLDGDLDLFSGSHGSGAELLAHDGYGPSPWGGFAQYVVADLDAAVRDVALADLDGDGDLDAVSGGDVSPGGEVLAWENLRLVDTTDPWSWSDYEWGWYARSVDLKVQAADSGSGVRTIQYRLGDHGPWADQPPSVLRANKRGWAGGVFTVQFRAVDRAGNVEPYNTLGVWIDRRAPVTEDDHDDAVWSSEDVTVQFDSQDELSGVRTIRYSIDGGVWQSSWWLTIAALENHANDGVHTVRYYAVDWAGNREAVRYCTVRIDTTAPLLVGTAAARAIAPAAAGGPARGVRGPAADLRVRFAVVDPGSARVAALVTVRDARGRVLARTALTRLRVGISRSLTYTGATARRAARVSIAVRDAAGFVRTRTLRL